MILVKFFDIVKSVYWNNPFMSSKNKDKFFYYIKGKIRGKGKKNINCDGLSNQYITDILNKQLLSEEYEEINVAEKTYREDTKLIAYYLPQFYPTPYNDKWWGKGATEWRNVSKGMPQYVGHYQPRLPGELGFYDLRLLENIKRQVELAKNAGVYAFCFYYYWFDGEKLLEKPIDEFVDSDINYPFCFCWANENWKKQWFGTSEEDLMVQSETVESYKKFIQSILKYLQDSRYLSVNGKKILVIYRPQSIPSPREVLLYWREIVQETLGEQLYIIAAVSSTYNDFRKQDFLSLGFDALGEFCMNPQIKYLKDIKNEKAFVCNEFIGNIFDYKDFVESKKYFSDDLPKLYRAISPMWDNTARKVNKSTILDGSTPELYQKWLEDIIIETQLKKKEGKIDESLIFINAWNEWSEGAYLEPDLRWGYGYLNATQQALQNTREKDEL